MPYATIGSYFIEGHVPGKIFQITHRKTKCSWQRAGMPFGSPGMELGYKKEQFDTLLVFENGKTQVLSSHAQPSSA